MSWNVDSRSLGCLGSLLFGLEDGIKFHRHNYVMILRLLVGEEVRPGEP